MKNQEIEIDVKLNDDDAMKKAEQLAKKIQELKAMAVDLSSCIEKIDLTF